MSSNFENTLFVVRKAESNDISDLVRMRLALQQHMEKVNGRILKHSEAWELGLNAFYSRQIDNRHSIVLVASDNRTEQIIGMALGTLIDDPDMKIRRYVKINDVWVN